MSQEEKAKVYVSPKYKELLLVLKPTIKKEIDGMFQEVPGIKVEFVDGVFETSDKEVIKRLEAQPNFGSLFYEWEETGTVEEGNTDKEAVEESIQKEIEEKNKTLEEKEAEIEELKRQLEEKGNKIQNETPKDEEVEVDLNTISFNDLKKVLTSKGIQPKGNFAELKVLWTKYLEENKEEVKEENK